MVVAADLRVAGDVGEGHGGHGAGVHRRGEMDYVDYAGADKASLLSFERWAPETPWEISTGKTVLPGELTVYPAPAGQ